MKRTFREYMLDWWETFIEANQSEAKRIMEEFIGEEEFVEDYLEDDETPFDWLSAKTDADEIYQHFFGYSNDALDFNSRPDTETFLIDMFKEMFDGKYDFTDELIEDMAYHAQDYKLPRDFFSDLWRGGCESGLIGMFIYNSDCRKFYCDHIDDMEEFAEEMNLEWEINNNGKSSYIPRYTFICWFCYEQLGAKIASTLYPGDFWTL